MDDEIVIFDIDGTLADVSERIHHLKKKLRCGVQKVWSVYNVRRASSNSEGSVV